MKSTAQIDMFQWHPDPSVHVVGLLADLIREEHHALIPERLGRLAGAWACIDGHWSRTLADVKRVAVVLLGRYRPNGRGLGADAVAGVLHA